MSTLVPRRPSHARERVTFGFDIPNETGDATLKMWKLPRDFKVERVLYVNPTGLAADGTNYFTVKLLKGSTVVASWSTLSSAEGALVADTWVELTLSVTDANLVYATDDEMKVFLDETGNSTLPAGRIVVEGYYL